MRPNEFAAYPYIMRVAANHITSKITKIQLTQINSFLRRGAQPSGELVVCSEGTYQLRSLPVPEHNKCCLVILNKHKQVARYEDNDFQRAAIDFITLVQAAEEERALLVSQEQACA